MSKHRPGTVAVMGGVGPPPPAATEVGAMSSYVRQSATVPLLAYISRTLVIARQARQVLGSGHLERVS